MIVKMEEYDILIRASSGLTEHCSVDDCEGKAAFNLHIINDSNHFIRIGHDFCGKHLMLNVIDYMTRS